MPVVKTAKPYRSCRSTVITLPPGWTGAEGNLTIAADKVALLVPEKIDEGEIEEDVADLLEALKGSAMWKMKRKAKRGNP